LIFACQSLFFYLCPNNFLELLKEVYFDERSLSENAIVSLLGAHASYGGFYVFCSDKYEPQLRRMGYEKLYHFYC
jgi:hypothetical protein